MENIDDNKNLIKKRSIKIKWFISFEVVFLILLVGALYLYQQRPIIQGFDSQKTKKISENKKAVQVKIDPEELAAKKEQEKLKKEEQERKDLIAKADRLTLGYDYDGAINLIKSYQGRDGGYEVYPVLKDVIAGYEAQKKSLVLYGGSYTSITQINHIFFHSLIADTSRAFDNDYKTKGYNMYMATVSEFKKIIQKLYKDGYVLVNMHDIVKQVKAKNGTMKFVAQKIYLPKGKKPFVLSQDDVSYYSYMNGDGFASRIVIGSDGKPTCEMKMSDGSVTTGAFDMVPIIDEFVEKHPDFSFKGAKGLLALTGYEGILGYRTNNPKSKTYEKDKEAVKKVAEVLKAEGWEFGSHSWGHKNHELITAKLLQRDVKRWAKEVEPLIGPTDIYIFPFGVDIETTLGLYKSEKYKILKDNGFDIFLGVYKDPWMQIWNNYVRMTRRPIDGQALLQFPKRLKDLFNVKNIIDPDRPKKDW